MNIKKIIRKIANIGFKHITFLGGLILYILISTFFIIENTIIFKKLIIGLILIMTIAIFFKTFFFRKRPNGQNYSNWIEKIDAGSFPSIHAMRITFMMLVIATIFSSFITKIYCYFVISAVCYSRIYLKKHHISDIVVGVIISAILFLII